MNPQPGAPLGVCLATSELAPFAKTGGLADAAAALARFLHRAGHDVRPLMPAYDTIGAPAGLAPASAQLERIDIPLAGRHFRCSIARTPMPGGGPDIYLLQCPEMYHRGRIYTGDGDEHLRFALLSRAAVEMCQYMAWSPDILHCNDWHTALTPLYLRTLYRWDRLFEKTRSVLTIHNIAYQGVVGVGELGNLGLGESAHLFHDADRSAGLVNFLRTGVLYADLVTTVSPTYCREIQTDEGGMGLAPELRARAGSLVGILNGVDYDIWNPETDPHLPAHYSARDLRGKASVKRRLQSELGLDPEPGTPLAGIVSRLTWQKGIDLLAAVLPEVLATRPLQIAALGAGEPQYETFLEELQRHFPGRVCFYRGYSEPLAHLIEAGADLFLMPSAFEPCGLNQMYSLRYGTVPVVRATGGLADSVEQYDAATGAGTGVLFEHFDGRGLRWAIHRALDLYRDPKAWRRLQRNGMAADFSWQRQAQLYVDAFRALLSRTG